jgi:hypothetical protein
MAGEMDKWVAAMRAGRYDEAWALSRAALAARDPARRDDPSVPYHQRWVWDGSDPSGRDVLVRCYHGLGDTIQFARFLPVLAERAASVTLEVQERLAALLSGIPGLARIVPFDPAHPLPAAECTVEITELDAALRISPSSVPAPYLLPPLDAQRHGTVAICYGAGEWDGERCIPPELFDSLCRRYRCVTLVAEPTTLDVLNPQGCPLDMASTVSLVAGADLVISVDTMIAHLAGAMGRPTWLMLKAEPDWRWAPDQGGSAWYPSMRLYVQPRPGDWARVLACVERDLAANTIVTAKS